MAGAATMGPVIPGGWVEFRPDNRGFATAVVVSVVFHSLVLASWHLTQKPVQKPSIAPGPIVARLAAPPRQAAAPEPAAPTPEPPKPRVEEPPPPPAPAPPPVAAKAPPTPVAKPAPIAKAAPSPAPAPTAAPSKPSAEPSAAPATPAAPSAPSAPVAKGDPAPAAAPAAAPAPSADVDPGTLKQYQLAIITTARKYKRYPRAAMDNNWEGKVEVRMVIGANGMIASMSIKTSTGHELLDKTALDMITKAKPLTPIPAVLRGKEFTVDVPVVFSLKEDAPSG